MQLGRWNFQGPWAQVSSLSKAQGVYAILGRNNSWESWSVVDIGQAGDVNDRVSNHDRSDCWRRQGYRELQVAVLYTPGWTETQRVTVEQELRRQYSPLCGVR